MREQKEKEAEQQQLNSTDCVLNASYSIPTCVLKKAKSNSQLVLLFWIFADHNTLAHVI